MSPAADWYPDPVVSGQLRYWSGSSWTDHTHLTAPPLPQPVPVVSVAVAEPASLDYLTGIPAGDVWLPVQMVALGGLPFVCVKHGKLAVTMPRTRVYSSTPLWVIPFVIFSLLVGLLIAMALRETVTGAWPMCADCKASRAQRVLGMRLCLATVPAAIALSIWQHSGVLMLLGLAAAIGALLFFAMSSWTGFTKATVERKTRTVRIKRPAAGFVAALPTRW